MFNQQFYYSAIKNYIGAFGVIFKDISIQRIDTNGNAITGQNIKVPISFGQKRKFYQKLIADPNAGNVTDDNKQRQVQIVLPAMSYDLSTLQYDTERKFNAIQPIYARNTDGTIINKQFVPVPYNFPFTLSIATTTLEDLFQIVEQILPYFQPDFSVTIEESDPLMNLTNQDVSILLVGGNFNDQQTSSFQPDPGYILYELDFLLKGRIYGYIETPKLITQAQISLIATSYNFDETTLPSNGTDNVSSNQTNSEVIFTETVQPTGAQPDSNWTIQENIEDKTDG